jgi:sn-glycerol 3-phosphate transport system substrate-binding protein
MIPTYDGYARHNTVVGGASLWVLAGKTEAEYRGAAAYLQFLATPESEEWFVSNTGYIPVTNGAFDALMAKGFYSSPPYAGREIALKSLTFTPPTNLTRGLRIGSMIQTRAEWTNEVTAALNGDKPVQEALDTAVARSNEILARFSQTYAGKSFP